ncbi:hypothetical protein NDU88_012412 [Pleurodeles waltl]|uniref:Uncharacterized protein n=1 Tax=Pleurodeles waltl TaxID=8319 RepID=A0AAV7R1K1_PLEWA|nr:hypothetical protein NDU88_012412 [Pleurodeles waltl]
MPSLIKMLDQGHAAAPRGRLVRSALIRRETVIGAGADPSVWATHAVVNRRDGWSKDGHRNNPRNKVSRQVRLFKRWAAWSDVILAALGFSRLASINEAPAMTQPGWREPFRVCLNVTGIEISRL